MKDVVVHLENLAERCIQLAYQCQNKNAERFLRLLAVDLMLAAATRRPSGIEDDLRGLAKLSRDARIRDAFRPESASIT